MTAPAIKPALIVLATALLAACSMAPVHRPSSAADGPLPAPPPPPPPPAASPPSHPAPPSVEVMGIAGNAAPTPCPLTIGFASFGAGIDGMTRSRVEALLASDRAVMGFRATQWGREGEVTLCVRTRAPGDSARLFQAIRALVPARPRGPISLRTLEGLGFESPLPRP